MKNTKNLEILNSFIQTGGKIKIRHHRVFHSVCRIVVNGSVSDHINVMTRGEYKYAQADGSIIFDDYGNNGPLSSIYRPNKVPYSKVVSNFGGYTTVELIRKDGKSVVGKFNFSRTKPFNRKIGFIAALGRAIETPVANEVRGKRD